MAGLPEERRNGRPNGFKHQSKPSQSDHFKCPTPATHIQIGSGICPKGGCLKTGGMQFPKRVFQNDSGLSDPPSYGRVLAEFWPRGNQGWLPSFSPPKTLRIGLFHQVGLDQEEQAHASQASRHGPHANSRNPATEKPAEGSEGSYWRELPRN